MLSVLKCLRDIANYVKTLPKYTVIQKHIEKKMPTEMTQIYSMDISPNSYVSITASAIWGQSKPTAVRIVMDGDLYFEGNGGYQVATATGSFYTETGGTLSVLVKYSSANNNWVDVTGFIMTMGG